MDAEEFNKLLKLINKDTKAFEKIYNFYYKRAVFHLNVNYRLDKQSLSVKVLHRYNLTKYLAVKFFLLYTVGLFP